MTNFVPIVLTPNPAAQTQAGLALLFMVVAVIFVCYGMWIGEYRDRNHQAWLEKRFPEQPHNNPRHGTDGCEEARNAENAETKKDQNV